MMTNAKIYQIEIKSLVHCFSTYAEISKLWRAEELAIEEWW